MQITSLDDRWYHKSINLQENHSEISTKKRIFIAFFATLLKNTCTSHITPSLNKKNAIPNSLALSTTQFLHRLLESRLPRNIYF